MAFILIIVGFVPSLLWLNFYLRKDCHPEPRRLIIETFFFGILLAPLAVAAQWLFAYVAGGESRLFFLWSAFAEEMVKFLAVYYLIVHNAEFDEPVDAMIYMVTAGLGFAAIENILVLFNNIPDGVSITMQILLLRTVGATLLHAVSSGLVGYFLALAWFHPQHRMKFVWFGIGIASIAHFAFNMLMLQFTVLVSLLTSLLLLLGMLLLISILFTKLRDRSDSAILETS